MENNWYLIDVTGNRTKWGFWGPNELNDNPKRNGERNLNSLQILSMLVVAYKYKREEKYLNAFK
jgi:hypothetical protein